ncbi:MAG: hypothetical protein QXV73_04265 [Candidatus Micrarchaeia archaeon]
MKRFFFFNFLLILSFIVYSCGGVGEDIKAGGGSGVTETVRILPPEFDKTIYYSDIAVWQDRNNDGKICDYVNDAFIVVQDNVNVTIRVNPIEGIPNTVQFSPVRVESVEVKYTPIDNLSPTIPTQYYNLSVVVNSGESATFPLEVIPYNLKIALQQRLICTESIYRYYVTFTFKTVEINSGKRADVEGHLTLMVGDFPENYNQDNK